MWYIVVEADSWIVRGLVLRVGRGGGVIMMHGVMRIVIWGGSGGSDSGTTQFHKGEEDFAHSGGMRVYHLQVRNQGHTKYA